MKSLPENLETLSQEEHKILSYDIANKLIKAEENLTATNLLIRYLEADPEFKEPRKIPFDIVWELHLTRLSYYSLKIQKIKEQLTILADLYEDRFEKGVVRRFWEE